jgi:hypothetical protein
MRKVKITKAQLEAIKTAGDTLSGMIGVGSDFDPMATKVVRLIDRFLKANNEKRNFR